MSSRAGLAGRAYQAALRLRSRTSRPTNVPVCPFDLAEEIGIEVRFADIPSMEAMYVHDGAPKILISADRPLGRQRFSCAHELGHDIFGHGTHLSSIDLSQPAGPGLSEEEFLAQAFAGFLLLPKAAVSYAFSLRGWDARQGVPEQYYALAGVLGVSFEALVTHAEAGLQMLPRAQAQALRAVKLPQLRTHIAGQAIPTNLTVVDALAMESAVDLRVGDIVLAPIQSTAINDALVIEAVSTVGTLLRASRPGLSGIQVASEPGVGVVRIARAGYVGRAIFRHLEDPDHV